MAKPISEKIIAALPAPPAGNKIHYYSGTTLQGKKAPSGFGVRVTEKNLKAFVQFYRKDGRQYLSTLGTWVGNDKGGVLTAMQAIIEARRLTDAVFTQGADPRPGRTRRKDDKGKPGAETVGSMLDLYVSRMKKDDALRSIKLVESAFNRLVKPAIGSISLDQLQRSHVMQMLDDIADNNGRVMSDRTLSYFRKACYWRAARDDNFIPPFVRGMSRTKPKEHARDRILDDQEIRDLWAGLDLVPQPDCFGRYMKFLLFSACRCNEASRMQWNEIDGDTWVIPGSRYKTKIDHEIPITDGMRNLLGERRAGSGPFVFSTTDGAVAFTGMHKSQRVLNREINKLRKADGREAIPHWTLHDLRRTGRSLMSRAGVNADHAERAIGHAIRGERATYDRHKYRDEKRKAFEALAAQLDRILHPTQNVTEIAARRKSEA